MSFPEDLPTFKDFRAGAIFKGWFAANQPRHLRKMAASDSPVP
jgi:hypothetical protein